jgi:hypothetical protein
MRSLTRQLLLAAALTLPATLGLTLLAPPVAHAQVSDSDRAAARELYIEGVKLQDQGKFTEALERFQRAQSVFSAPTHLLHIAECQAALGRLVESAETYRTLVRTPLPAGSPPAFVQAQQQGAAELTQVEPRIPTLKLHVKPEHLSNMTVQIDGQPMSAALVGVARPTNPGVHTVAVFAPGYGKSEQQVTLKEKEQKEVTATLQQTSGVIYGPAVTPTPNTQPANPPVTTTEKEPAPAPPPAVYEAPQAKKRGAPVAFMFGPHMGLHFPGGNIAKTNDGTTDSTTGLGDHAGTGFALGIDGGIRFARVFYVGASFEHGFYGKGKYWDEQGSALPSGQTLSTTIYSNFAGVTGAWISNPDGVGFYLELGVGYRWFGETAKVEAAGASAESTRVATGTEGMLGLGVHIKAGDWLRLIPKVAVYGGTFKDYDTTGATTDSGSFKNTDTHSIVFLGIGGFIELSKKSE